MSVDPQAFQEFAAHVGELQQRYGVELTEEGAMELAGLFEAGAGPEHIEQAFGGFVAEEADEGYEGYADDAAEYDSGDLAETGFSEAGLENLHGDVMREIARLQSRRGRPFTMRELEALGERMAEQATKDDHIDGEAALASYEQETGQKPASEWSMDDRVQHAIELGRDRDRVDHADDPPEQIDMSTVEGKTAYAIARLEGRAFDFTDDGAEYE